MRDSPFCKRPYNQCSKQRYVAKMVKCIVIKHVCALSPVFISRSKQTCVFCFRFFLLFFGIAWSTYSAMSIRRKCIHCKLVCQDRHAKTQCTLCNSLFHSRCLNLNHVNNRQNNQNFLCGLCLRAELPFQMLNDNDMMETTYGSLEDRLKIFEKNYDFYEPDDNAESTKYYYYSELPTAFFFKKTRSSQFSM